MVSHLKKPRSRQYTTETVADTNYTNDLALLTNTPAQAKSQLHSLKQMPEFMCFGKPLKSVDQFTYFGSSISSIENDVNICQLPGHRSYENLISSIK